MKNYTVLLLYPDYMNEGGVENYLANVKAENSESAITAARIEAMGLDGNSECDDGEDFAVLAVFDGHLQEAERYHCHACNRPESICSAAPCPDVIADRGE